MVREAKLHRRTGAMHVTYLTSYLTPLQPEKDGFELGIIYLICLESIFEVFLILLIS